MLFIVFSFLAVGILLGYLIRPDSLKIANNDLVLSPTPLLSEKNCIADQCLAEDIEYPVAALPAEIKESLRMAIDDEYKAYSTYQAVIEKQGGVRPFIMISRAEQQHIASLQALFDKYGLEIPENPYAGNVNVPLTIQDACKIGVQAEIDNIKLYEEKLIPIVSSYEDITQVYTNLMNASDVRHLPAFQRCD